MHSARTRRAVRTLVSAVAGLAVVTAALATGAAPAAADPDADRPSYLGKTLYTGEFHSHTSVSDGVELPPDAFEHVQSETDADFFTVSEHDVMWDIRNGDDFLDDWRDADSQEWRWLHEQTDAYNARQDELVAVPSIENTWYDGTGHINVFNTDWHATARATEKGSVDGFGNAFGTGDLKYDLPTFFARLKLDPDAIGQFNHPSPTSKGNFFGFSGLDPEVDDRMDLIEVKSEGQIGQYQTALDKGWHLGPVWNGDEHSATWVSGNESVTGVWAEEHSLPGLYAAMKDRSVYSTEDVNTALTFGADEHMMGSILPADTGSLSFDVSLKDPDGDDRFTSATLYTNGGKVAHEFSGVSGNDVTLRVDREVADGDYYFVRAAQADGDFVVSAPIWVGATTRGANYAPVIDVQGTVPTEASYGERIALPEVTATDDSGAEPTVGFEVYDAAGLVPVEDGAFRVRSYDDHFIVVKATDATGNTNADLLRITVDQADLDPAGVFQYFGATAAVAEQPGGAGIAVSTDRSVEKVYAQVLPAGSDDWSSAPVLTSTNNRAYEVNTIGNDEPEYQHSITGQTLRSHEFDLTDLDADQRYKYRLGVAVDGAAPAGSSTAAWTDVQGEFVAGGAKNQPVYLLGDLQAQSHDAADLGLLRGVLDRLRTERPGGRTAVQLGDLVDNGGRGQYWEEVHEHVFDGLDVQVAPVAGNHETYGDPDYNAVSGERTAIFSNMYDLPKNGVIGESSYSFDRGDVHFSVLNSNTDVDAQLAWLVDDVRASDATWNVVMGHFSYYGGSHADDPGMAVDREKITKVLDQLGVDLYVGAHDHTYKRSTVFDGRLATTADEEAAGTTYVTMGSSGPKFYDNVPHWWDDVVFDENTQVGAVLDVTDDGLRLAAYTIDGRLVDDYTVRKPHGSWELSSAEVVDRKLPGVGFLSHAGSRDTVAVTAATYDNSRKKLIDLRTEQVTLDHAGREQYVAFDSPLEVRPSDTVKIFTWDSLANGKPLRPATTLREGLAGEGTAEDPYRLDSADDLAKIDNDPAGHYLLTADLDLGGKNLAQIGRAVTFTGVFDGGGHTVKGFHALAGQGAGLFAENHGTIRDLVVDARVETDVATAGLLVDINHGTVERVRTQGSITAASRVGGIVGDHHGQIRDSYSTADVRATGMYSGGVVGIALGGSLTENVYASGAVTADGRNAGGVVSYGYDETEVRHAVSLNRAVSAPSFAHAIVGRVSDGQVAVLADNHASASVPVSGQSLLDPPAADNWKGALASAAQVRTRAFFEARGWDFTKVWDWSADGLRPVLRVVPEGIDPVAAPTLPTDERGFFVVDSVEDLAQVRANPSYDFVLAADLDLSGSAFESVPGPFVGELDGAGHTISGLTSTTGGLFANLAGSVHDLALVDADVEVPGARAGILANVSTGTVERVRTSGSVSAGSRAGGILGDSSGVVRDAYSTASVHVTSTEAGGVIGVALSGSTTERVYATGEVTSDLRNIGGVVGYGYTGTTIRDSLALNPSVTAPTFAHRVLGRVLAGNTATLERNWASESVVAQTQATTDVGPQTLNGATVTTARSRQRAFYADDLGWDLGATWAWDEGGVRPVLQAVPEDVPAPTGPALPQDSDGAFLLSRAADLAEVVAYPDRTYRLAADLDLGDAPGTRVTGAFSGELDGAGHVVRGFASTSGGLFAVVTGSVHDLTLEDAAVETTASNVGLLVDRLDGSLERVATTGSIRGGATVGGIAGFACGTIRDSSTAAAVTATAGRQAGGVVGIAGGAAQCSATGGSTLDRTYAAGPVEVVGNVNAGGISGYAYTGTTIRHSIALNPTVTATGFAQRIVARTLANNTPTLVDNHASAATTATLLGVTETGPATFNGATRTVEEVADRATYADVLGWDLDTVWAWDSELGRPVLRTPSGVASSGVAPSGPAAEASAARVTTVAYAVPAASGTPSATAAAVPRLAHDAELADDGTVTVTVHGGAARAGNLASVVVMPIDGDLSAPTAADLVHLDEVTLDEQGEATLEITPPKATLAGYALAINTSSEGERYLAALDPDAELPTDPDPKVPASVLPASARVVYGRAGMVAVTVKAKGVTPTGTVSLRAGSTVLGTAVLKGGSARIPIRARALTPRATPYVLTVAYGGDGKVMGANGLARVTVSKGSVALSSKVTPSKIRAKKTRAVLKVRVTNADRLPVSGRVTVSVRGRKVSATVVNGVARVRLPAFRKAGRYRVIVRYAGSSTLLATSQVRWIRVRR